MTGERWDTKTGVHWRPVGYVEPDITEVEIAEAMAAIEALELTAKEQAQVDRVIEYRKARVEARGGPLSQRVADPALHCAQALQALYDETRDPQKISSIADRGDVEVLEAALWTGVAHLRGMVKHPVVDGMEAVNLWEPVVG